MEQEIEGRSWVITVALAGADGEEVGVHHLFDISGSEVFDPTLAFDMMTDNGPRAVMNGDEFRFTLNNPE